MLLLLVGVAIHRMFSVEIILMGTACARIMDKYLCIISDSLHIVCGFTIVMLFLVPRSPVRDVFIRSNDKASLSLREYIKKTKKLCF